MATPQWRPHPGAPLPQFGQSSFGELQSGPATGCRPPYPVNGDLIPVLMRTHDDDQVDLLGSHSRALIGRYRPVRKVYVVQVLLHSLAGMLLIFAFGYLCWHLGRAYGRAEEANRPAER